MLKQIHFLWNRGDKESRTVGVGGQGEEGSEKEGREEEGIGGCIHAENPHVTIKKKEEEGMGEEIIDGGREK